MISRRRNAPCFWVIYSRLCIGKEISKDNNVSMDCFGDSAQNVWRDVDFARRIERATEAIEQALLHINRFIFNRHMYTEFLFISRWILPTNKVTTLTFRLYLRHSMRSMRLMRLMLGMSEWMWSNGTWKHTIDRNPSAVSIGFDWQVCFVCLRYYRGQLPWSLVTIQLDKFVQTQTLLLGLT